MGISMETVNAYVKAHGKTATVAAAKKLFGGSSSAASQVAAALQNAPASPTRLNLGTARGITWQGAQAALPEAVNRAISAGILAPGSTASLNRGAGAGGSLTINQPGRNPVVISRDTAGKRIDWWSQRDQMVREARNDARALTAPAAPVPREENNGTVVPLGTPQAIPKSPETW